MTRRSAMWLASRALAAAGGEQFFAEWLRAAQAHPHNPLAPPEPGRWSHYPPRFFSPQDFAALEAFTAILIPTDEQPGAREANVAPYIDFVLDAAREYAPEMQAEWRKAFDWLRQQRFHQLAAAEQGRLVGEMAGPEMDRRKNHAGFPVYRLLKEMTVHAFYTSRAGLVDVLEYQGNAYLEKFPGCDHPGHRNV